MAAMRLPNDRTEVTLPETSPRIGADLDLNRRLLHSEILVRNP